MKRAFQWDLGRQIEKPEFLMNWLPRYAEWGYEQVYLYLEDAFDFPSVPGVGRHRAWTPPQMDKFVAEATRRGLEVIPIAPLMGHASYLLKNKKLLPFSESRDAKGKLINGGQLCPLHEGMPKLACKLIKDLRPYCTAGIVHVGLDESFSIGTCPLCRAEVKKIGLPRHFANHAMRLHDISSELGLRMGMWADMLYYVPEAIAMLPKDVIAYDWYYYPFKKFPKVEFYNFADVDLTGALHKAGLDVFGCPNNGAFFYEPMTPFLDRLRNILSWWHYGRRKDVQGLLMTSWAPTRTSVELNSWVDAAAASLWLDPGITRPEEMLKRGLQRVFGKPGVSFARTAAAVEKYQYTSYYRWQANGAWDKLASFEPLDPWRQQERYFQKLAAHNSRLPVALRESLKMRHYIAARDLFIREGSTLLAAARRATRQGKTPEAEKTIRSLEKQADALKKSALAAKKATRILWQRSRYLDDSNPNEVMLQRDLKRIAEIRSFLTASLKNGKRIWNSNPLLGRWHLLFHARNFAPALQGMAVEVRQSNGEWKTVHSLYSLEFTADAGNARTNFLHRHSVPLEWKRKLPPARATWNSRRRATGSLRLAAHQRRRCLRSLPSDERERAPATLPSPDEPNAAGHDFRRARAASGFSSRRLECQSGVDRTHVRGAETRLNPGRDRSKSLISRYRRDRRFFCLSSPPENRRCGTGKPAVPRHCRDCRSGSSAQAYRTATGLGTWSDQTSTESPSILASAQTHL